MGIAIMRHGDIKWRAIKVTICQHVSNYSKFPPAAAMDHMWVSHEWIYGLGLSQYSAAFEAHLVDGRLLGVLTKKDLDKHLGVHRKCHQTSVMHAIDLLRLVDFDKQVSDGKYWIVRDLGHFTHKNCLLMK